MIFADKYKFALVLRNLISRAISVSSDKQEVNIFLYIKDPEPPKISSPVNSVRTRERRGSTRSNRIIPDASPETDYEREVREEEEREMLRERLILDNQILRIEIHDSGPVSEVSHAFALFDFE